MRTPYRRQNRKKPLNLAQPVVLVGLMGAGKTTIGHRLASRLGVNFFDMDKLIEEAEGMSVSDIFSNHGEPYFRAAEREAFARLMGQPPSIIATGGGAFVQDELRARALAESFVIWLDAPLEVLTERTGRRNTRPLLATAADPAAILADLLQKRTPFYIQAHARMASGDSSHDAVVSRLVAAVKSWQDGRA